VLGGNRSAIAADPEIRPIKSGFAPIAFRVAAIQMAPVLGDVDANMRQAESLVRRAVQLGAQWIVLPEFFTSAAAFHPGMLQTIRPIDGAPSQLLQRLASENKVAVGGSFLAMRGEDVYNSFVLAFPDGRTARHDKDLPTLWENCYYIGGHDDGVLDSPVGPIGAALCWEFIRTRTARRLAGRVRMVLGGSTWWTLPDDTDPASPLWAVNLKMMREAIPDMARMLGVPIVHAAHAGRFEAFFSPDIPDVPYNSSYLGEAMIVDADGKVLARRAKEEGAGVVVAEITLPSVQLPREPVPERFWIPVEMPQPWHESWQRWFTKGSHYYKAVTQPYIQTGVVKDYTPDFL
jgi:predicted amidohydrolase